MTSFSKRRNSKRTFFKLPPPFTAPTEMYSHGLLARCQSEFQVTVTEKVYLTLIAPSVAEHMTVGSTGWMPTIEPRPVLSCISSDCSHSAPFHCVSSPAHRSHMRQAIGFGNSVELALKSRNSALPFSVVREASVVSVGDGSPRITTLHWHSGVSISSILKEGFKIAMTNKSSSTYLRA